MVKKEKCKHNLKLKRSKYNGYNLYCSKCDASWSDNIKIIEKLFSELKKANKLIN